MARFEVGREYVRKEIHAQYGGQEQQGISTPAGSNLIFLITGKSGAAYGYDDDWEPEGVYRYYGAGRTGHMLMEGPNERVRDHAEDGSELHLFRDLSKGRLRYEGEMVLAGWKHEDNVPDLNKQGRRAIVFYLAPVDAQSIADPPATIDGTAPSNLWSMSLETLREKAQPERFKVAEAKQASQNVRERSRALRVYVLRRAHGKCEGCDQPAPFTTPNGQPFLEAHHTRRLSDGGPDSPRWVIAVCPNCHRRAHYASDAETFNDGLKAALATLEASVP